MLYPTLASLVLDSDLLRDALADLAPYPFVTPEAISRRARMIGLAGEALVDSLLLRHGLQPASMPDGASADRLIPFARRSIRLQIKTRTQAGPRGYSCKMLKGYRNTPQGVRASDDGDFDIGALVVLPLNAVVFTASQHTHLTIPVSLFQKMASNPLRSLDIALTALLLREAALPKISA